MDLASAHLAGLLGYHPAAQPQIVNSPLAAALAPYLQRSFSQFAHQQQPMPFSPHPAMPPIDPRVAELVGRHELKKLPQMPMGLDTGAVNASASFSRGVAPATPFRVTAIEADPSVSQFFSLSRISIGLTELIVGSDVVKATAYNPDQQSPPIDADDLFPGVNLTIAGNNDDSGAAHRMVFTIWGINLNPRRC